MGTEETRRHRLRQILKTRLRPGSQDLERVVEELEAHQLAVDATLGDLTGAEGVHTGFDPASHLAPGVPRLRTLLVGLSSRAAGGAESDAKDVARVAEMMHLMVVLHDAALGRQGGRRRRVARRLLRVPAHFLGGNHLTLRALELARAIPSPEVLGEAMDAMRELAEGHALSEDLRHRDASESDYLEYAESHSGALYSFCTRAGAHLGGADRSTVGAFGRYGRHVGVAWHAVEDQWLLQQEPEELVRTLARRSAMGRPTLPVIRALNVDPSVDGLLDRLCEGEVNAAGEFVERIRVSGGLLAAKKLVVEESMAARRSLRGLQDSPYLQTMDRVAGDLINGPYSFTV
jgi:octaprenyl-diphosphate synthase